MYLEISFAVFHSNFIYSYDDNFKSPDESFVSKTLRIHPKTNKNAFYNKSATGQHIVLQLNEVGNYRYILFRERRTLAVSLESYGESGHAPLAMTA